MKSKTLEKSPKKNGVHMEFSLLDLFKFGWGIILPHNWYLHRKADNLQKEQAEFVRRKEFDETINSLRNKMDEGHRDLTSRFDDNRREMTDRFDKLFSHLIEKK